MIQNKPNNTKKTNLASPLISNRMFNLISPSAATENSFSTLFRLASNECVPKGAVFKLVCTQTADKHWDTNLTDFRGEDLKLILGDSYPSSEIMLLDLLIPEAIRTRHKGYIDSIFNEKQESKYWDIFLQKLNRDMTIIQPQTQLPHLVNISIRYDSTLNDALIFEITLTDKTIENRVANKAGLLTHNIRSTCRNIINRVSEDSVSVILRCEQEAFISSSSEELNQLYDIALSNTPSSSTKNGANNDFILLFPRETFISFSPEQLTQLYAHAKSQYEKSEDVCVMSNEILHMCADSREDFLASAIKKQIRMTPPSMIGELASISERLRSFIDVRRISAPEIPIYYLEQSNSYLESDKINIMEQLLLNLITNAIQAMNKEGVKTPKIIVNSFDTLENQITFFRCEVIDNGPGMSQSMRDSFFKRPLPKRALTSTINNDKYNTIENNRGEGTMMAFLEWEEQGGVAAALEREDGESGTRIQVGCRAFPSKLFSTAHEQRIVAGLDIDKLNRTALKGSILLVDDQYSLIKLMIKTLITKISIDTGIPSTPIAFNQMQASTWKNKVTTDIIGDWGVICASNGQLAYEVVQRYSAINLMITDFEMPEKDGINLIKLIRKLEQSDTQREPMRIILNTGCDKNEIEASPNEETKLDFVALSVDHILKGVDSQKFNKIIYDELDLHHSVVLTANL